MSIKTIGAILAGRPLNQVGPGASLQEAATIMAGQGVGALAVLDGDRLVGIVSERDIVFRAVARGLPMDGTTVAQVMTCDPVTVEIDHPISDALAVRLGDAFRHLPVTDNGRVVGLLSYRDIPAEYLMLFERFREMSTARADEA
ncbi:CBS domain-containing protein [Rhodovulum bhavnagarense]|nr:CBS domain-containing protein [Rhodovulum bhavnagarense]